MAKIKKIRKNSAGKQVFCGKCRKEITPGMDYLKATPFRRNPIIRCLSCGLKAYETSSSEYVQEIGALVEDWDENYGITDSTVDDIRDVLETQRDNAEESLSNMPDHLQESSETGMMLQERIDQLEEAIGELDSISLDDCREEARDEAVDEIGGEWPEDGDDEVPEWDFATRDEWEAALEEAQNRLGDEASRDAVEEALSCLEY